MSKLVPIEARQSRERVLETFDKKRLEGAALEMAIALQRLQDNYFQLGPFPGGRVWDSIVKDCFTALSKATGRKI